MDQAEQKCKIVVWEEKEYTSDILGDFLAKIHDIKIENIVKFVRYVNPSSQLYHNCLIEINLGRQLGHSTAIKNEIIRLNKKDPTKTFLCLSSHGTPIGGISDLQREQMGFERGASPLLERMYTRTPHFLRIEDIRGWEISHLFVDNYSFLKEDDKSKVKEIECILLESSQSRRKVFTSVHLG